MPPGSIAESSASLSPAPYGQACLGCSRAKCKCFYRSDGTDCERCHRLGKVCEPAPIVRKRKARTPPPPPTQPLPPPVSTRLEEKLDDLVTLLRSQAAEKQAQSQTQSQRQTPQSINEGTPGSLGDSTSSMPGRENPDLVLDTAASIVHILRPETPLMLPSPILEDVSVHQVPDGIAEEQLDTFRRVFLSTFPFVHIPITMSAAELRRQKPFLWLVIMALTTKMVAQQFAMADTIWHIISLRIVSQHLASLDLLLGVIGFASWSHYFKKDKPFMNMLSQLAVSLASELDIHHDIPTKQLRRSRFPLPVQQAARRHPRTLEERRTMLAVFHLTSSAWSTYRKTEPLRWTPYLDDCIRVIGEGRETYLDALLVMQIKCQIITNELTISSSDEAKGTEDPKVLSLVLSTALLRQLGDIGQGLPSEIGSLSSTQFYLLYTELKIRESLLGRPSPPDQAGLSNFQRLRDLESVLNIVERWLAAYSEMPLSDWVGISVDIFTQFMQYFVVLFKLSILDEPGWDLQEVRRRANIFEILDRACDNIDRVPVITGMVDAEGPRSGLFFKMNCVLRDVKALFLAEMPPDIQLGAAFPTPNSGPDANDTNGNAELMDFTFSDEFLLSMLQENILGPGWNFRPDNSYMPFTT
ncbi:hypothetical protein F4776DRAFT_630812 [Hypoxylon sp. NC0597]|nr:hypothetical protein F4776DRAFT_630812 [Hypoxylon sp. NC0597]